ncbi:MAG TPA: DNA mismatch repair endonuclease MutL [Dehalococcoidia bacterium]|jgi:DNA mismatch repair protein MutL|nr:DNA mismatch repair protein MutL [Chloroflexota bacterium]MDP6056128.1 DNA mismatch repair endonuclease MutL [Dehalococcoidia bacterium]MDP7262548.1 DNA mismatch repair endonuclease MutL [Dehalococcoidia bacterium]MDP7484999.1 DNA mismatch repair endonuclease MutL [Dehalococcoidia bacterium]HJP27938.1 DNA mismatch repair endonuclease MutL [Dehalococcoidia bacterium]|tara:strand:- start:1422 stop:3209 length:1788 start_codon:yes stop_codon:yes gene_type:complete
MPIQVLSDDLASRIAAGEVIERPASVVKELLENSLDAGSTRIDVNILGGGAQLISVVDNGQGIPADELAAAFERFATSKIDESSDLIAIETLGFRGEALPSIASVARVEAVSKHADSSVGAKYLVDFGKANTVEPAGAPQGTRIEVAGLFKNVPARLKFLGSAGRELSQIQSMLSSLALVYPQVAFSLNADGRERVRTIGSGKHVDAVSGIYGATIAEQMLELEPDDAAAFAVDGLVSSPSLNRSNRTYVTISVNGRWIQSRRLSYAIEQAYHGFLPDRRFPIAIARITAPLGDVDANVHPAKAEVRFLRENLVYSVVQRAVRGVLSASAPVHGLGFGRVSESIGLLRAPSRSEGSSSVTPSTSTGFSQWPDPSAIVEQSRLPEAQTDVLAAGGPTSTPKEILPILRVIGQAHETYILAEGPEGVYLVDQHAAHERVMYERVQERFDKNVSESQPLLEPAPVDLAPGAMNMVHEHLEELNRVGWGVEEFGTNSLIVRSVPGALATRANGDGTGQVFIRVLDELSEGGTGETWRNRMLATIACHSSIRAGQVLSTDECKNLIRELEQTERPNTCPHGRPTIVQLNVNDLEREFKRR